MLILGQFTESNGASSFLILCREAKEIQVDGAKFKIWPWNKMGRNRIIRTITNYLNEMRD